MLAAPAPIVPQHGVGVARVSMTKPAVRQALGGAVRVRHGNNDFGRYDVWVYKGFTVTFQSGDRATAFTVTGRAHRTVSGVGVGSTEAQVAALIRRVKCRTDGGFRHCYVGTWKPGRVVTDFAVRAGHVTRVTVGYVLD